MYQLAVVLIVTAHLAFIGYVIFGGFWALRRHRTLWLHLLAVLWGIMIVTVHLDCPLTGLERMARAQAKMNQLPPDGFIAHYLAGVVYPVSAAGAVELAGLAMVVVSWCLYGRDALRRRRQGG